MPTMTHDASAKHVISALSCENISSISMTHDAYDAFLNLSKNARTHMAGEPRKRVIASCVMPDGPL